MEFRVPPRPTALSPGRGTLGRVCPEPQRAARPPNHLERVSLAAVSRSAYAGTLQKAGPALGSLSPGECDLPERLHSPPAHGPAQVLVPSFTYTAPVLEKGLLNNYF